MSLWMRNLKLLLTVGSLSLVGCTSLLGDFSYDPNGPGKAGDGNMPNLVQGDIVVMPTSGLVTSEQGAKAAFTIVLKRPPTATVAIALTSSNEAEGTVSPKVLSFTAENYAAPQLAQITGVDDTKEDGPQKFTITTSPATSEDKSYHGIDPIDPEVTNIDDDTAGVTLLPPSGLITTESGGEAKFTVQLNHAPTADVTIPLSSDNAAEGSVSPASLTFTALNWMAPQMVTVTGVNDDAKDGPQKYHVVTGAAMSGDANYNGLEVPDEEITNQDNDSAGVVLTPPDGLVTFENGMMTSLTIALSSPPTGDVTLKLDSSDSSEGLVSPPSVTFTPLNWMAPQVISVTGVDDDRPDGDQPYFVVPTIENSADPDYAALEPPNAAVTNIDDDSPGFLVAPTGGLMTREDLTSATFTVVLKSRPAGTVLFGVTSNRPEEGVASPAALEFTEENWNGPQVVTVMGVNDDVADGDQSYVVHVTPKPESGDAGYVMGLIEQDVMLTNVDDDQAGITVDPQKGLQTTEAGGTATFSIRLNSKPKSDVSIALSSNNTAEGNVAPGSVTFTPDNWNAQQMVTVRGVDDAMQDGNQPYRVITQNATSDDPGYDGMEVPNVEVTNIDNDSAGITCKPSAVPLVTTENGGTATFTVVLNSQPATGADVSFNLTSSDTTEGTVNPGTLKFTGANWNAPQTVTVKGVDDKLDDGRQNYHISFGTISSADPNYAGDRLKPLDVQAQNTDNDTAGITLINVANLTTAEKGPGTATFQVVLDTEPTASVSIALSSSKTSEGTVAPAMLTFTPINWAAPQTVTLTGVDDKVADGSQQFLVLFGAATSQDAKYQGKLPPNGNVTVTNLDDDSPGIIVSAAPGLSTSEPSGTATFTIALQSQPTADVTIPLASSKTTEGTVSPASLTFTAANWNAPRTVTLTGVDDKIQDGDQPYFVKFGPVASADAKYNMRLVPDLAVSNRDNDTAGIVVSAISGDTTEKSGTATFTVVLLTQPTADVSLDLTSSDTSEGSVSPAKLTFTAVNWASPQVVTVTGVDDKMQDGTQPYTIDIAPAVSNDGNYKGKDPADVSVNNKDDDTAGITVSKISGNTSESGGTATFTIVLDTQPAADVSLTVSSNNTDEGTVSDSSVSFTGNNWSSPKTITVTGVEDDSTADGNQPYAITFGAATSTDKNYSGKQPAAVSVINLDNDTPNILVSASKGQTSEDGDSMTFTVNLGSKPKANVTIPISSNNENEGTVSTSSLLFTSTNWSAKQSVTVTGVDDPAVDGSATYKVLIGAPTSTDAAYADIDPPDIDMTNVDNDTAGFVVSDAAGHTTEGGGTTTFTIRLRSKPSDDVTITLTSSDPGEGTTMKNVVLTSSDWNTPHVVTVHGENDDVQDGPQPYTILTSAASSNDPNYDQLVVKDVAVTNDDNDTAGYTIGTPSGDTNEDGGTATFSVALSSQPTDDVSIPVMSSNTAEGTLTITSLNFTTSNWKTPQIVTVKGVDDDVKDGNVEYNVVLGKPSTSGDANYAALDPPDVTLTNDDNDSAALSIAMPLMNTTTEAGGTVTFNVTLTSKPKGSVTIPLASADEAEGIITVPATGSLTFTAANWNMAQPVTVQGVDDALPDGDRMYKVQLGPPSTQDPDYGALGAQFVNLVNLDDEPAVP